MRNSHGPKGSRTLICHGGLHAVTLSHPDKVSVGRGSGSEDDNIAKGLADMIELIVNGIKHQVDVVPDMPLLWVLIEHQVPQCSYCQTGQIMQAISLLELIPKPTDEQINEVMSGNLCRCGT